MKKTIYLFVLLTTFSQLNLQGQNSSGFALTDATVGFGDFPAMLFGGGTAREMGITEAITSPASWETWVSGQPRPVRDLVKYYEDQMASTLLGRMDNDPAFLAAVRRHYRQYKGKKEPLAQKMARENMARFQYWRAHKNGQVVYGGFRIALRAVGPHGKGVHGDWGFDNGDWSRGVNTTSMAKTYVDVWTEKVMGPIEVKGDGLIFRPMNESTMQLVLSGQPYRPLYFKNGKSFLKISSRSGR